MWVGCTCLSLVGFGLHCFAEVGAWLIFVVFSLGGFMLMVGFGGGVALWVV